MERESLELRAQRLLTEFPLIDGHNDLPFQIRIHFQNQIYDTSKFTFREGLFTETDIIKVKKGQVGGQFWSVYVQCGSESTDWDSDEVTLSSSPPCNGSSLMDVQSAVRDTLEQIDTIKRLIDEYDEV